MNPAITAALIAAAHEEGFEESVIGKLREAKATGPSSAVALDVEADKKKLLDEAIAGGIVSKTADGRFYLNERAIAERKEGQGHVALVMVFVALSILASGAALLLSSSH